MKILLVITGLAMGGAEQVVVGLADKLALKGHDVRIAYLTGPAIVLPSHPAVQVVWLGMKRKADIISAFLCLRKLILNFKPDVVHSHMVHANLLARVVKIFVAIPRLICTAHSTNEGGRLRMLAYRLTDSLADISTNVSQAAVTEFEKKGAVPLGRMISVLNGIDTEKFSLNIDARQRLRKAMGIEGEKVMLAVGRLFDAKDYPNLLRAFRDVLKNDPSVSLWIVGDGPLRANLEALVESLGCKNQVNFLGIRRDISDIMSAADVFVLSSAWEGFGLVVGEAMATRRVVVATDCGGVRELLADTGYLVRPSDPVELSRALRKALSMPMDEADTLGLHARQRIVDGFSLKAAVERWLKIYSDK